MPPLSNIAVPYFTTAYHEEKGNSKSTKSLDFGSKRRLTMINRSELKKGGFLRLVSPIKILAVSTCSKLQRKNLSPTREYTSQDE